jgi:hypothetical protein
MDAEMIKKALEALEQGDDAAAMEILKGMIVSAASGEEPEAEGDEPGAEGDGAEGVATPEAESVIDPKVVPAAETSPEEDDEDDPKKKMARKALHTMLRTLTGTNNLASALVQVSTFRKSHLTLETERQELANQRAILESAERRQLVVELVKLGAEFPSTVWADATSARPSKIKPRWAKMPIVELRAHVADQRTARGRKPTKVAGVRPPRGDANESPDDVDENGLTRRELKICSEMKCDPKDFALLKASRSRGQRTAGEIAQDTKDRASRVGEMVSLAMRPKGFKEEGN